MANELAVEVVNLRAGGGQAVAFFNVNIGYKDASGALVPVFAVKDFALKRTKAGGFFFQPPSKPRMRNGEHVTDDNGYKIYDPTFDIYVEAGAGKNGGYGPTKASARMKNLIIEQASAAFTNLSSENSGRGSKAKTTAGAGKVQSKAGGVFGSDDDESYDDADLPF